ncbi:DUF3168 domain-containing protein [Rhizobium deserti]|uniref:DUF3168 domain-containing protein n=1 Tax=Rhizobium deserti TaxID=2547961 RepID=A0A4R5ULB0_9HYPH|nr:DUF3168 domain-containing protein [Rhizobium deserti]TDK38606.1 DUF3168 domain-containing protein [Rhizobium deserti]
MSPEAALQKAIRARLISTAAVTGLVPASSILDRNQRPAPSPSIILGEAVARDDGETIARSRVTVFADVHVWKREPSLEGAKDISGAIRAALRVRNSDAQDGFHIADWRVASTRFLRDPDGETSHGVMTIQAIVEEI